MGGMAAALPGADGSSIDHLKCLGEEFYAHWSDEADWLREIADLNFSFFTTQLW